MWVCVSNNFDVNRVIADMLESLKKKKPDLESLDALQGSLKSEVMSKKFLLVLDDIWDEDEERDKSKWENVLAPLSYGSLGSKILVTTRMDSIALTIAKVLKKKKEILRLKGLKEDVCLQLLNTHAFDDVENPDDHKKLKSISREIVKKLFGSPLAAKVIGGVLNSSLDERHWIKILRSGFKSVELGQKYIFSIIRLSYIFLPKPLQNCFSFCCIFPQDHIFYKNDLVRMWIAVGFIQPTFDSEDTMEDIGGRHLDTLVKKSFFDKFQTTYSVYYKMHDLLHELAQSICAQECFRAVGDKELFLRTPETIRHLSVTTRNLEVLKKMPKFENLRSLFLVFEECDEDFVDVLTVIFKSSKSIRLLHIKSFKLRMISEAMGDLIHLRYLNIHGLISFMPRSLSNLYHLQFLKYDKYYTTLFHNEFLPKDMNNLSNLRYVEFPDGLFFKTHGIGKLTSLQNLDLYVKNENGYRIGELENMNGLQLLKIKHLKNLKDAGEACNAKLCDKRSLTDLSLEWCRNCYTECIDIDLFSMRKTRQNIADPDLDERMLDNLQPHKNLKKLKIVDYMGVRSAIWMNKALLIYNLEYIELYKCVEWQTILPFGQLPFLKSLRLYYMPKVKRLDNKFHGNDMYCAFPSLEVLRIENLEALEYWFDATAAAEDRLFPCLTKLELKDCPNLQELPYFPPKLEMLEIVNIGWKSLNYCSILKSIPLETLKVCCCPNMAYIHLADEITRLTALRILKIQDCPHLISLGEHQEAETTEKCQLILSKLIINDPSVLLMEPLRSLTSIQNLEIMKNDEMVSFSIEVEQGFLQVSSSLCSLDFNNLLSLQSLPSTLESFSSLRSLFVVDVPKLQLLPNIPASLELLELRSLKSLRCLPSSLSTSSSLKHLKLSAIPLKTLPHLPFSLCELDLSYLYDLNCLFSCPSNLSSLKRIDICEVPKLRELSNLPPSLEHLIICNCYELKNRYEKFTGSDWHKIAHIPHVYFREFSWG